MNTWTPLALGALLMVGCRWQSRPLADPADLRADEVMLIGRVSLDPPLRPDEQVGVPERWLGVIHVLLGERWQALSDELTLDDLDVSNRIDARHGQLYGYAVPRRDRYLLGGFLWMRYPEERVVLPGGLRVEVEPADRVLYMGHLVYCRDRFFEISHALLFDELARDVDELSRRVGRLVEATPRLPEIVERASGGPPSTSRADADADADTDAEEIPLVLAAPGDTCASTAP